MKAKCRVFFIRKSRMRSSRVQTPNETLYEAFTLPVPLVQPRNKEWRRPVGQPYAPLMAGDRQSPSASKLFGYRIEKAFHEGPKLTIRTRPFASCMSGYCLIEVAQSHRKAMRRQQSMNFIIRIWEIQLFR